MFEFFSKLSFGKGAQIFLVIFGIIITPYWFLYQFFPTIINSGNYLQQLVICVAIGAPMIILVYLTNFGAVTQIGKPFEPLNLLMNATALSSAMLYLPCCASYFWHLNSKDAINTVLITYGVYFLIGLVVFYFKDKNIQAKERAKREIK